jgi:hypothetical protein
VQNDPAGVLHLVLVNGRDKEGHFGFEVDVVFEEIGHFDADMVLGEVELDIEHVLDDLEVDVLVLILVNVFELVLLHVDDEV